MSTSLYGSNLEKHNYNIKNYSPKFKFRLWVGRNSSEGNQECVCGWCRDLLVGQRKLLTNYAVHVKSATKIKKRVTSSSSFEITGYFVWASANGSLPKNNFAT